MNQVTLLLNQIEAGDERAADELLPMVYEELRQLASARLKQEKPGQTLQATALVHEAYLRLVKPDNNWKGRAHFFGAAAEAMRRILVEQARRKKTIKHGAEMHRWKIEDAEIAAPDRGGDILEIHEVLERFEKMEPQVACLVKLRYFAGFTVAEAAEALGISTTTADRNWAYARAWLHSALAEHES